MAFFCGTKNLAPLQGRGNRGATLIIPASRNISCAGFRTLTAYALRAVITGAKPAQTICRRWIANGLRPAAPGSIRFQSWNRAHTCPGSLDPVLDATNPARSHCEFRRHNRVYAGQGVLVNEPSPPISASYVVACLGKQRMLRFGRHSRTGRFPHAHSRNRMDPTGALIAGYATGNPWPLRT